VFNSLLLGGGCRVGLVDGLLGGLHCRHVVVIFGVVYSSLGLRYLLVRLRHAVGHLREAVLHRRVEGAVHYFVNGLVLPAAALAWSAYRLLVAKKRSD